MARLMKIDYYNIKSWFVSCRFDNKSGDLQKPDKLKNQRLDYIVVFDQITGLDYFSRLYYIAILN